jgi:hypothetical protein
MSLKLSKYIPELRNNANKMEQYDLTGHNTEESKNYTFSKRRIASLTIGIIVALLMGKGFSSSFISYVSAVLSILVGLFINSLIFGMDKFYKKPVKKNLNSQEKLWDKKSYNYNRQFLYITGYNIVRCIFTLVILSLSAIFPLFNDCTDLRNYTIAFEKLSMQHFYNGFIYIIVFLQKFLVIYWIGCIVHNTLFIVSSMVTFMVLKSKTAEINNIEVEAKTTYSVIADSVKVDDKIIDSITVEFKTNELK